MLARLGKVEHARETLEAAQREMPSAAPLALQLRFEYADAIRVYFSKHFVEARTSMLAVVERARHEAGDLALVGECESALALFMQREGDVRAAARYARAVLENRAATLESRYRAFLALGSLHQDAYDYDEASRLYREAEDVVRRLDDDIAMASWLQRAALTQAGACAAGGRTRRTGRKIAVERSRCFEEEHCLCQCPARRSRYDAGSPAARRDERAAGPTCRGARPL